jgi:hypothetical protein
MGLYELECEFDVVRRIGWSGEDLAEHIDDIFERLHQANDIQSMTAEANLDTGRSRLSVGVSVEDGDEPRRIACSALGVAIRSCGGAHIGLLTLGEEATQQPSRSRWSGLRLPTWHVRSIHLHPEPSR